MLLKHVVSNAFYVPDNKHVSYLKPATHKSFDRMEKNEIAHHAPL